MHKISVKSPEGEVTHGNNIKIMLDGKELEGVTRLEIVQVPNELARVQIELIGQVDVDIETEKVFGREPQILKVVNGSGQEIGEIVV